MKVATKRKCFIPLSWRISELLKRRNWILPSGSERWKLGVANKMETDLFSDMLLMGRG